MGLNCVSPTTKRIEQNAFVPRPRRFAYGIGVIVDGSASTKIGTSNVG